VELEEVVREETERFAARARERGIEWSVATEPVEVVGSAADLALAVRNLCDNALRYTDSGGSVRVALRREDGWAVLEVADTGVGIPTRALPRVFERFYRVDLARSRATGGTGLGLAIVKHVAERHGGTVGVESELGRGSVFRVRLPLGVES
jgi:signal transduction histidine kinase